MCFKHCYWSGWLDSSFWTREHIYKLALEFSLILELHFVSPNQWIENKNTILLQMLPSKDANFVGYTYKNFEIVNDDEVAGIG